MPDINFIEAILVLAERHGLSLVLLILVVALNISLFAWLAKKFDRMLNTILDLRSSVPNPARESVEEMVLLNSKIKECLVDVMANTRCQWAQLWQFHNGAYGIGKPRIPFMFLSLTHEICEDDCREMRTEFSQLPLSMFDTFANELVGADIITHEYRQGDRPPRRFGQLMTTYGASYAIIRTIRDVDNKIIGFITVVYEKKPTMSDNLRTAVVNSALRMSAIMATVDGSGRK